jgi:GTP cyclohydrolase I
MAAPTERLANTARGRREDELAVARLLLHLGENPDREGLRETPARVSKFLREATAGYEVDVPALLKTFDNDGRYDQMVNVGPIPFYSLCEHHMVPFFGSAWVAYVPKDRIVGLSKLARVVDAFARRLQVQERLTQEIANAVALGLEPKGVGVMVKARHLCMEMRGVEKAGAFTTTTALRGVFMRHSATRGEWLRGCQ